LRSSSGHRPAGWFKDFLFNIILIASVSTLLFNANPLMRFDGYYIMTDLIEVPNLQGKSRALIQHQINKMLFGSSNKEGVLSRLPLPASASGSSTPTPFFRGSTGTGSLQADHLYEASPGAARLEGLSDWFAWLAGIGWVGVPSNTLCNSFN